MYNGKATTGELSLRTKAARSQTSKRTAVRLEQAALHESS